MNIRKLNAAALNGLLNDRVTVYCNVRTVVRCSCDRCGVAVKVAGNAKALGFLALHGGHGSMTFELFKKGGALLSAWGSFG